MPDTLELAQTVRYYIEEGYGESLAHQPIPNRTEAPYTGYWILNHSDQSPRFKENLANHPLHFNRGELLDVEKRRTGNLSGTIPEWTYLGLGQRTGHSEPFAPTPLTTARIIYRPGNAMSPECHAGLPCPTAGIWYPVPIDNHPQANVIDPYIHQRYLNAGAPMPDATSWGLPTVGMLVWRLLEADEATSSEA